MFQIGLIVNPVAGMGGRVGLKGTDGEEVLREALRRGARPASALKAARALRGLRRAGGTFQLLTCPEEMGESAARMAGLPARLIELPGGVGDGPEKTRHAARIMMEQGVDLLLFSGGDGTARDLHQAVGEGQLVLGIPAGVKLHSAVFGRSPEHAGEMAAACLGGMAGEIREAEVMDIDEVEYRRGVLSARLYGYLRIPYRQRHLQRLKTGSPASERHAQQAIAREAAPLLLREELSIVGPGTTLRVLMDRLGLPGTLLGVDLVKGGGLLEKDVDETAILRAMRSSPARVFVTPIGGQGFLFGRGNQQISPAVIDRVGKKGITILSTRDKLHALESRSLLLDTGDRKLDRKLEGYYRVITGGGESAVYRVEA